MLDTQDLDRNSSEIQTEHLVQISIADILFSSCNWSEQSLCDQRSNFGRPLFGSELSASNQRSNLGIGPSKVYVTSGATCHYFW